MADFWGYIERCLRKYNPSFNLRERRMVSGGCINTAYLLKGEESCFFIKLNEASKKSMFEAEYWGLEELRFSQAFHIPKPIRVGVYEGQSFILMEALTFTPFTDDGMARLGKALALLHQQESDSFGWERNNTIGSSVQINKKTKDWISFFRDYRLQIQYQWAYDKGLRVSGFDDLLNKFPDYFLDYVPKPSLLHGDLWIGNVALTSRGDPVLFDPAVYYGDRETDLAFSELFGGFSSRFYEAYQREYPLAKGYESRKRLYNLYHLLNHYNLFGEPYGAQVSTSVKVLLEGGAGV